jgi:Fic family protein
MHSVSLKIERVGGRMFEKKFAIRKPYQDVKSFEMPSLAEVLGNESLLKAIELAQGDYLSWDEFRRKSWATSEPEHAWTVTKFFRSIEAVRTPIKDQSGNYFTYTPKRHLKFLHEVDLDLGGSAFGTRDFSERDRKLFIRRSIVEESISSSKLEGANTSREAARHMLVERKQPKTRSERMIFNNHLAMTFVEEIGKRQPMSMELLLHLHRQVTQGTLADTSDEGKLRETLNNQGKRLVITPWDQETVAYVAPDKEFVDQELPAFINFANDDDTTFIHPLIKAIFLHFWIGLLHPFEDGNGRLARIIFYWYMLKKGYWAFSYLSLSERILNSPTQYAMAYVNSEQDDFDLNYFVQYNIEKLILAREKFERFLLEKMNDNRVAAAVAEGGHGLNNRQIDLLRRMKTGETRSLSSKQHATAQDVGIVTASSDLNTMVQKGLLRRQKNGRNMLYLPTDKVAALFR